MLQCLHRTFHHKKISGRDHTGYFTCSKVKRLLNYFRCSHAHIFQIRALKTWLGHGTKNCMDSAQFETFFRSQGVSQLQTMTLGKPGKASVITFACSGGVSAASANVDVDVLVHSSTNIWPAMLDSWLDPAMLSHPPSHCGI